MTPPSIICFHPLTLRCFFWVLPRILKNWSYYLSWAKVTTPQRFVSTEFLTDYICPSTFTSRPFKATFWTYSSFAPYLLLSFSEFLRPLIRAPPLLCGTSHDRIHKDRQHWSQSWYKLHWYPWLSANQFAHTARENSCLAWAMALLTLFTTGSWVL